MTLVLLWKHEEQIVVIADTLFRSNGKSGLEVGPKIFSVPIRIRYFENSKTRTCLNMGFAFAGFTSAGQVTHAIASAGLQNLAGSEASASPSVEDVTKFYARCGTYVVDEMRRHFLSDKYMFEGVVFGWQSDQPLAYSFEIGIDADGRATSKVQCLDFAEHGLYTIGQGHERVQDFIMDSRKAGRKASPYDALLSVITDESVPSVGGSIQAAIASFEGVDLKPILQVDELGLAKGGFMGAEPRRVCRRPFSLREWPNDRQEAEISLLARGA